MELRDYRAWHRAYDDPRSSMSWRLGVVREWIGAALGRPPRPPSVLSLCAGDGRDILGALRERGPGAVSAVTLVELDGQLAEAARAAAAAIGVRVDVRVTDAGSTSAYADVAPADLVLLVGIFGNISDEDLYATIDAAPGLCAPGATLLWSRGRDTDDQNDAVRARFGAAGFVEIDYAERDEGSRPAAGVLRYDGPPVALPPDRQLFTFVR